MFIEELGAVFRACIAGEAQGNKERVVTEIITSPPSCFFNRSRSRVMHAAAERQSMRSSSSNDFWDLCPSSSTC
jgi:hypothetical protein